MGVLLHKAANCSVPDTLVDSIVKEHESGAGCIFIKDGVVQELKMLPSEGYGVAGTKEMLELLRDLPVWFHFTSNTPEGDFQPYKALTDNNKPLLYVMGEGDFSQFHKTDGSHPDLFYAVQDYFLPKFSELYARLSPASKDMKNIWAALNGTVWQMDIKNTFLAGCLILFGAHGAYQRYIKGGVHSFSWGWTTNAYDYKETEFPDKGVVTATKNMVDKLSSMLGKAPSSKITDKPAATAIPAEGKTNEQLVQSTQVEAIEYEDRYPPPHFVQERNRRQWYKGILSAKNGVKVVLEDGYSLVDPKDIRLTSEMVMKANKGKGLAVRIPSKKKVAHSLQEAAALVASTPAQAAKALEATATRGKDVAPHHIPSKPAASVPGQVVTEVLPVLSDRQNKALDTFFSKKDIQVMLDMSARKVPFDPKTVHSNSEVKFKTLAESRGLKDTRQLSHLTFQALVDMGKADIQALAMLCDDWRALAMQYAPNYEHVVETQRRKSTQEILAERKAAKKAS